MTATILIIDDDPVQRRLLDAALTRAGHRTLQAGSGEDGLAILSGPDGGSVSALVLDLVMPGLDGIGVLERLREAGSAVPVIVQTAKGGIETVVGAMRAGAFDFVVKPVSPERIQAAIAAAIKVSARTGQPARKRGAGRIAFTEIISSSPAMERTLRLARKAGETTIPVMIEGESGVGKELLARAIQSAGDRRGKPFVTVNCGAIPANLVESILFGHEKGSFTGATERHIGKFAEADGGTLFLDEIGDLPVDVQVKLLRAVQEGEVDPVGSRQTLKVDIRIISATHRDLAERVRQGLFREDLYYRLNVFPIRVPPLRERRDDIGRLIDHFIRRHAAEAAGSGVTGISASALDMLSAHDWPGNIRELENAVFRALVLAEGPILTEAEFPQIAAHVEGVDFAAVAVRALEMPFADPMAGPAPAEERPGLLDALDGRGALKPLSALEEEAIRFAIDHCAGQISEVARRLGIGRSTLYRKMREYGLITDAPENDGDERAA